MGIFDSSMLASALSRWVSEPRRACTNCWRSSAALYSLFSFRSPCSTAFRISCGNVTFSSCMSFSPSAPSFRFSSSIIDTASTPQSFAPGGRAGRFLQCIET
jgi:hypothetical protein